MILRGALAVPLALLVAIVTVSISFNVGIGAAPQAFFGTRDTVLLGPLNGAAPGKAPVPTRTLDALRALPYVSTVSPEIYAITVVNGRSVFVRGVDARAFLALEHATIKEGRAPALADEALAGEELAHALALDVGSRIPIASSFDRTSTNYRIVGILAAEGPPRDELMLTIEGARRLTDLAAGNVHLVRVETTKPTEVSALIGSRAATFTYSDVRLSSLDVFSGQSLTMRANLTNWGIVGGTKLVEVRDNGDPVAALDVYVPARTTIPIEVPFSLTRPGVANVSINPTFNVTVREPLVQMFADQAVQGAPFVVHVLDPHGQPQAGVRVELDAASNVTDAQGMLTLIPARSGWSSLTATIDGKAAAQMPIFVAADVAADRTAGKVLEITPPADAIGANATSVFKVRFANEGGSAGATTISLDVDGVAAGNVTARLEPGQFVERNVTLPPMGVGLHVITSEPPGPRLTVKAFAGRDPRATALMEAIAEHGPAATDVPNPVDAREFVDRLLGNVALSVVVLSICAAILTALGAFAVISRHVAERSRVIGALKAIGATDEFVLSRIGRESLTIASLASIAGLGLGMLIARVIDQLGIVRAFGHTIRPVAPANVLALIAIVTVGSMALSTRVLAKALLEREVDELLRGENLRPSDPDTPELSTLLETA